MYVVAGRKCALCEKRVVEAKHGVACAACAVQFHRKCLTDRKTCARCGLDLDAAADAERAVRRAEIARTMSRGRAMLLVVSVAIGAMPLVALAGVVVTGEMERLPRVAIQAVAAVVWVLLLHRGSEGIAKAIMVLACVEGAFLAFLGTAFVGAMPALGWTLVVGGGLLVLLAIAMFFSDELWRYLAHLRAEREGDGKT